MKLSNRTAQTLDQPINYFMQQAVENANLISLAAGLVDAGSLPVEFVARAAEGILSDPHSARTALQYGTTQGYGPLREQLAQHVARLDNVKPQKIALSADDCIVTNGSQQLLYLLGEVLLDPGDIVITASPSYFVFQGTLQSMGVETRALPSDQDGLDTQYLEELLEQLDSDGQLHRVKLIYVVDYYDNPAGTTLSADRRKHVLELARRFSRYQHIFILEDSAYRELRYDGPDLPSIRSLDVENEHVILAMTFSKPFAPGLKTGYGFVPRLLRDPILRFKSNHDFGSNNFTQHVLHEVLRNGSYTSHVNKLREIYCAKRDVALETLGRELRPEWAIRYRRPSGGLFIWLSFPEWLDTGPHGPLMKAALEQGILFVPGRFCYLSKDEPPPTHEMRLNFGVVSHDELQEGIRRLARAIARVYEESQAPVKENLKFAPAGR